MTDIDLLRRVVEQIELDPDSWDQSAWRAQKDCRTTFCIAGWTCVLAGMVSRGGELTKYGMSYVRTRASSWDDCLWSGYPDDTPWEQLARDLLDISQDQADLLFNAGILRDVATLRTDIKGLTGIDLDAEPAA